MGVLTLTQVLTGKKSKGFTRIEAVKVSTHELLKEEAKKPKAETKADETEKKADETEKKADETEKKADEKTGSKAEKQRSKFKV